MSPDSIDASSCSHSSSADHDIKLLPDELAEALDTEVDTEMRGTDFNTRVVGREIALRFDACETKEESELEQRLRSTRVGSINRLYASPVSSQLFEVASRREVGEKCSSVAAQFKTRE